MTQTPLQQLLTEKRPDILSLGNKYGIQNIRVFGSVARGEEREDSDIDFLVDTGNGRDLFDWFTFWADLEEMLEHKVDVVPEKNLRKYLRSQILAEAKPL